METNMYRLNNKVAIIFGAGRGIGRATAKLFAAEGAKVAVLSVTQANIDAVVADIEAAGGTAIGVGCDVSDDDQIKAAVAQVADTWGRIDILVNNAFDPSSVSSSVLDLSVEQLQRNFEMGPIAYLRTMQACYPHLKASGEGRVINLASLAGILGMVDYAPYNMAKEAVRARDTIRCARVGRRQDHREQRLADRRYLGRSRCAAACQCTRPPWLAAGGRRTGGSVPRQQGCAVHHRLQPHARWRNDHRRCALSSAISSHIQRQRQQLGKGLIR